MAIAVAMATIAVNAASYSWSATEGRLFNGTGNGGSANYITSGSAYLVFASDLTQAALVSAFASDASAAASTVATKAVSTGSIGSDARISATGFTYDTTADQTAYFVVFNGDNMYVSGTADAGYMAVGTSYIAFESQSTPSKALPSDAAAGFGSAGWYQASAVPEPTSGLLMLLGMAGLALRRRRA